MTALSSKEIEHLLLGQSPAEIRHTHLDRLDARGLALLEREDEDLGEIDQHLKGMGAGFRASVPPMPKARLPEHFSVGPGPRPAWWKQRTAIPNLIFPLAAALCLGFVGLAFFGGSPARNDSILTNTREATLDPRIKVYDGQLFDALRNRSVFLLELGDKSGDPAFYR